MNDDTTPSGPEAGLHHLMHDAVSGVRPQRGLEDLVARIDVQADDRAPGRLAGRLTGTAAAVVAIVLVTGGVAYLHHQANPSRPAPATGHELNVSVYYLGKTAHGQRLFNEQHLLSNVTTTDVQAALNQALGTPDDPDYHSGFPAGTTAKVIENGDSVIVDFADDSVEKAPAGGGQDAHEAVQALVWTITDAEQRPVEVDFEVKGERARTLLGKPVSAPVTEGSADAVMSPVSVQLEEDQQIPRGTVLYGEAAAFEGTVEWQLRQGEHVVKKGFTTTGQCCTLSRYAIRIDAPPGDYTLVVSDTNPSGREGYGVTSDSKDLVIE